MSSRGEITKKPNLRMRILLAFQIAWVGTVCLLGFWWAHIVSKQAQHIAELERKTGVADTLVTLGWLKTERMLFWESSAFLIFLLASMALMIGLYWRDTLRARSIQAFFASVTHELKTPLTSIRLQAESITDSLPENHEARSLTERLLEDTTRLETQVERVLELARLEGGGPVFTQNLGLRQLVDRFLKTSLSAYRDHLEVRNEIEDCEVYADPTSTQVILRNLFDNAIRHNPGDRIQVNLKTVRSQKYSDRVGLLFQDTFPKNIGIQQQPAPALGKLFEKGSASQGTGVGLYLVKKLMERMGGRAIFHGVVELGPSIEAFQVSLYFKENKKEGLSDG